jgi:hypothetical protein
MITDTQYALLVGVPTGTVIFGFIIQTIVYRKWMKIFRTATERSNAELQAALERQKIWEGTRTNV